MRLNAKISEYIGSKKYSNEIGLEIETELNKGIRDNWDTKQWVVKGDGSLRGNGYEFVLPAPVSEAGLEKAVSYWSKTMKEQGLKCNESDRTSIHVHKNVQNFTVLEAINGACLYWLAEPFLVEFCGSSRKGNNFCLTLQDADGIHSQFIAGIKQGKTFSNIQEEAYRYSSQNLAAINRFGSLENRLMRGTDDPEEIINWAKAYNTIINAGKNYKNPSDIVNTLANKGSKYVLDSMLTKELVKYFSFYAKGSNPEEKLLENAMYIYEIAEARKSWDFLKDEGELKKEFDKLINAKLEYLYALGYGKDEKEAYEIAKSLLTNDLKARGNIDFNQFLGIKEAPAPRVQGRAASHIIVTDDDEPIGSDFLEEEDGDPDD